MADLRWRTSFEETIARRRVDELQAIVAERTKVRFPEPFLSVKLKGTRIRAWYQHRTRYTSAPVLRAELIETPQGDVLVRGTCWWTLHLLRQFAGVVIGVGAPAFLAVGLPLRVLLDDWEPQWYLGGLAFALVTVYGFLRARRQHWFRDARAEELALLRSELHGLFDLSG